MQLKIYQNENNYKLNKEAIIKDKKPIVKITKGKRELKYF